MTTLDIPAGAVDPGAYSRAIDRLRDAHVLLPTFAQLADPATIPETVSTALKRVDPDAADPLNLFRIHWFNDGSRAGRAPLPEHVVLPPALTGVDAKIVVVFGNRFPMIRAHKVLAAYACLAPRIVSGGFDPSQHRAVWPSTGNYCRGGVAISRILGCRGVALLPEGMSEERFAWLRRWVADPSDIVTTPGTESNVKEIYDACSDISSDPSNVVLNQFSEYGNHLVHWLCTGRALGRVYEDMATTDPGLRLRAFVSASGSAGTLAAGDHLKETYGAKTVAVEALECPTMLRNGFGAHNIQGIGDKHIPLIHNVMNTDIVTAVSDRATDQLSVAFASPAGLVYLRGRRNVPVHVLDTLNSFGLSSICNVIAAVKVAKHLGLGSEDVVITVATDGADMYASERARIKARDFANGFDETSAGAVFGQWMLGADTDNLLETTTEDRARIFNLGYYTWVEQQGVPLADFEARRRQEFWRGLRSKVDEWDQLIGEFNARTAVVPQG